MYVDIDIGSFPTTYNFPICRFESKKKKKKKKKNTGNTFHNRESSPPLEILSRRILFASFHSPVNLPSSFLQYYIFAYTSYL